MSVYYSSGGEPHNFELVAPDGSHSPFSAIHGFTDEVKIATVRNTLGGFNVGELFTGNGIPGQIVRIAADGSTFQNPWVTLPGENGLLRGSLSVDRTGVFGGDLLVVTDPGGVWRVNAAGTPTRLANLGAIELEGVNAIPNDPQTYGPWAGTLLTGAEDQNVIWSVSPQGTEVGYDLGIVQPEDINVIPANENFFGVDYGGHTLWGGPAAQFAGLVGDILVTQEDPAVLWDVHWDASSQTFQKTLLVQFPGGPQLGASHLLTRRGRAHHPDPHRYADPDQYADPYQHAHAD